MNKDLLRFKILLQLLHAGSDDVSERMLASSFACEEREIREGMQELAAEGLLEMDPNISPHLTEQGFEAACALDRRFQIQLYHLLNEGAAYEDAAHDASYLTLYGSEEISPARLQSARLYRAKLAVQDRTQVSGGELCRYLPDGEYRVPFFIYRANGRGKSPDILSMANAGFEQPSIFKVHHGFGTFYMTSKPMIAKSRVSGLEMQGKVESVKYMEGKMYIPCDQEGDVFSFPAFRMRFQNILSDGRQVLHGSAKLSMRCDVGIMHMPESVAVAVFIL